MPEKKLSHDLKGEVASENEAIIVVAGEGPCVETEGDRKANAVTISAGDKVMLGKLRDSLEASGKDIPVVAIIIGGRSLDISEYENMFDEIKRGIAAGSIFCNNPFALWERIKPERT